MRSTFHRARICCSAANLLSSSLFHSPSAAANCVPRTVASMLTRCTHYVAGHSTSAQHHGLTVPLCPLTRRPPARPSPNDAAANRIGTTAHYLVVSRHCGLWIPLIPVSLLRTLRRADGLGSPIALPRARAGRARAGTVRVLYGYGTGPPGWTYLLFDELEPVGHERHQVEVDLRRRVPAAQRSAARMRLRRQPVLQGMPHCVCHAARCIIG